MYPSEPEIPAEHDERAWQGYPVHGVFTAALASRVQSQQGNERCCHDNGPERCTFLVQERVHYLFEREELGLFIIRKFFLLFLSDSPRMRNIRVHRLFGLSFLGQLVHLDGSWYEVLVREDEVQQEREYQDRRDNDRDDDIGAVGNEFDAKGPSEDEIGRIGGHEDC